MSEIVIEDNFLLEKDFKPLQAAIMSPYFPWFFSDYVVFNEEDHLKDNFQFTHTFIANNQKSNQYQLLNSLLEKINPKNLLRVKANLGTRNVEHVEYDYHTDFDEPGVTTGIFYINTNNGYTRFVNGKKVDSIANRYVTFDGLELHSSVSQTNTKSRVVLNFNYK